MEHWLLRPLSSSFETAKYLHKEEISKVIYPVRILNNAFFRLVKQYYVTYSQLHKILADFNGRMIGKEVFFFKVLTG